MSVDRLEQKGAIMGHSFTHQNIKHTKSMDHPGYGNTAEFAAMVLRDHWREIHKGQAGGSGRPYTCQECRHLWLRASLAILKEDGDTDRATPLTYHDTIRRVYAILSPSSRKGPRPSSRPASPTSTSTSARKQYGSPQPEWKPAFGGRKVARKVGKKKKSRCRD